MGAERELTARLSKFFPRDPRRVPIGIGDDAALVRNVRTESVLTCDPVIEGVHFAPDTPLAAVGRKVVMRNASDIAAMGATPDFCLLSVVFRRGTTARARRALFSGVRAAALRIGAQVVGGDIASADAPLCVTVSMIGHLDGPPLRRDRARFGDSIHVTGPLGGSILGRHLRIRPRLAEGRWLARQAGVRAGMDLSDGLALDLWTLLQASGVSGAELDAAAIPIHRDARRLARTSGRSPLDHALSDGEDHELLFTVAARGRLAAGGPLESRARQPIGRVIEAAGLWLKRQDGGRTPLEPSGWQHAT